ncbi:MAG: hypothetical protein LRY73_18255 [Bacillus sp. (in: Bacteria)]|nr:hypothetical protein [Bacillus sp. (in: firmicutes)]
MECRCHDYEQMVLSSDKVINLIGEALVNQSPLSLTRFSHAEITYLNWRNNSKLVNKMEKFRDYNGATLNYKELSKLLEKSLKETTITGLIPKAFTDVPSNPKDKKNGKYWYRQTKEVFHRLNHLPETVCSVWSTQEMIYKKQFWKLLKNKSIIVVGRRATESVTSFQKYGVNVVETMNLEGIEQVEKVKSSMATQEWDLAIVAAGIPATLLTPSLAKETGRVVIDFGHALDKIIDGDDFDFDKLVEKWSTKKMTLLCRLSL